MCVCVVFFVVVFSLFLVGGGGGGIKSLFFSLFSSVFSPGSLVFLVQGA